MTDDPIGAPGGKNEAKARFKAKAKAKVKAKAKRQKDLIRALSPEQRDRLMRRLADAGVAVPTAVAGLIATPRADDLPVPMSFAQERAWFRARLAPTDPAHILAGAIRFEGELSVSALQATLTAVVARHETLRAQFQAPDGQPQQKIAAPQPFEIDQIDLSDEDPDQAEKAWGRLYRDETRRAFDLTSDLLLRATLVRRAAQDHQLLISMHHIASDGWSIGVVMGEMATLYQGFAQGLVTESEPALPALPVQYGDYAAWQRRRLDETTIEKHLDYWRRQLADLPPVLALVDDPPPAGPSPDPPDDTGATATVRIDRALKERLERLSRSEDTTLFVVALTGFLTLLMRLTGREDLVVGSPVSGRDRVETESLVGLFVNTLVVRARLTPLLNVAEAIGRVRTSVLDGLSHGELPFERIVQAVDPERAPGTHPLFDIVFNLTPSPPRSLALPGVRGQFVEPPSIGAKFSMELFVTEWEGALELKLVYPAQRYAAPRMQAFLEQIEAVLGQMVGDPSQTLGALDLVTPAGRVLLPDPTAALEAPVQTPIVETISAWVTEAPAHPALEQEGTVLSYADFGRRVDDTARALLGAGFEPGTVVAVRGPRCPGVVIAMTGCLRAGGVLLTVSHDLPEERQRVMLTESGARFVLQVGPVPDGGSQGERTDLETIHLALDGTALDDTLAQALDATTPEPRLPEIAPSDPAYVFFTSGSTGRPKGILGTHAGLAHFLRWQHCTFEVGPTDRCAQLTGLSFDVVLRDVFLPLTAGATLVFPPVAAAIAAAETLEWLDRERITRTHTVPSVAESWLRAPVEGVALADLRTVFFAGEPLTDSLVDRWRRAFPRAGDLINLYGPTETTLAKCSYRVPVPPRAGVQPLGRPMPQAQALVLGPDRRLCGIGEPGEIAIRTPFRSRGYLNAEAENASQFLPNPFRDDPDDLLYRTGDRGFVDAFGELRFLGRLDHQVKIRGVRVEPMEVAVVLEGCPGVASCAVIAREEGHSGAVLVGYIVAGAGSAPPSVGDLQAYLRQRLPAPMIPTAFVFLDSLPLTTNHKLDRDRLPAPEDEVDQQGYVAPRNAVELQLVQIWEQVLDIRPIGVTASFFEVGGHSLMALQLLMEIDKALSMRVDLNAFLAQPTIEALAAATHDADAAMPISVPLWSADHPTTLFLVHPGGGTLLNYVHLVRYLSPVTPVVGLQAQGLDGREAPHDDLEQMAAAYVDEIRRQQATGPYLLAGHSLGGVIAFEMARQLEVDGQTVALLALLDATIDPGDRGPKSEEHISDEDARRLADMTLTIERFVGRAIDVSFEGLRGLGPDQQIERVVKALEASKAMPLGDGIEQTRRMLAVSKAHLAARRGYRPQRSSVPITLLRAGESEGSESSDDETLGWASLAPGSVHVLPVPGDHVTMMREPHIEQVATVLRTCLDEALGS